MCACPLLKHATALQILHDELQTTYDNLQILLHERRETERNLVDAEEEEKQATRAIDSHRQEEASKAVDLDMAVSDLENAKAELTSAIAKRDLLVKTKADMRLEVRSHELVMLDLEAELKAIELVHGDCAAPLAEARQMLDMRDSLWQSQTAEKRLAFEALQVCIMGYRVY